MTTPFGTIVSKTFPEVSKFSRSHPFCEPSQKKKNSHRTREFFTRKKGTLPSPGLCAPQQRSHGQGRGFLARADSSEHALVFLKWPVLFRALGVPGPPKLHLQISSFTYCQETRAATEPTEREPSTCPCTIVPWRFARSKQPQRVFQVRGRMWKSI